jgi:flagellar protein FlbD
LIPLTRPDGSILLVNPDRIEHIEETPDTVVTLADGRKLLVRETAAVVAERFRSYQRSLRSETRFGGRRKSDPTTDADPEAYEHPARPRLRLAPRSIETDTEAGR